jgi:hypothetical protein
VIAFAHLDNDLGPDAIANNPDPNANKRLFVSALDQDPAKTVVVLGAMNLAKVSAQYPPGPSRDWWPSWFKCLCPAWREPAAPHCQDSWFPNAESIARELAHRYERRWQKCSAGEKVTLHEVASNGFSSRRRPELRPLLANRLLRLDPQLRLCNESFRRFVLARFNAEEVRNELPPVEDSLFRWSSVKTTLGITLTLIAIFLFITQREAWTLVVGLASTFATGFGKLSQIPGLVPKGAKKEQGGDE